MEKTKVVWLVGAGEMASDYIRVLMSLDVQIIVIGRGGLSASSFFETHGIKPHVGGIDAFLATRPAFPDAVIVAVGVEALAKTTKSILQYGVRRILLEKPGALYYQDIYELSVLAKKASADVFIAYNRRMYASTLHAQRLIAEDKGVISMNFEFTEWSHVISPLHKAPGVKESWVLGNSTHVIDLAFYLGGRPVEMHSLISGSLDWHPTSAVFAGAGRTDSGVLFSYNANWMSPGRWGVEFLTANYRLILRPLEQLQIVRKGSVVVESVEIDDHLDKVFKPGLYEQTFRFLSEEVDGLCTLDSHIEHWSYYARIANYEI